MQIKYTAVCNPIFFSIMNISQHPLFYTANCLCIVPYMTNSLDIERVRAAA